jgi:hypothetical protein
VSIWRSHTFHKLQSKCGLICGAQALLLCGFKNKVYPPIHEKVLVGHVSKIDEAIAILDEYRNAGPGADREAA